MVTKILHSWLIILLILLFAGPAQACVGRFLYVGALDTAEEKLMAEMLVILINERTGTTVKTRYFDKQEQIYQALKSNVEEERLDIIVEDSADALALLKTPRTGKLDQEYTIAKKRYEEELNIIWLNPFGFTRKSGNPNKAVHAPLVRRDVLTNFPLLPRVLNKLAGAIDDAVFADLLTRVQSGEKHRNVAKDFLRTKKFI